MKNFVNNCTICAVQKLSFHPLAAKPIIARNFLSCVQVNIINLYYILFKVQLISFYNRCYILIFAVFSTNLTIVFNLLSIFFRLILLICHMILMATLNIYIIQKIILQDFYGLKLLLKKSS